MLDVTPYPPDDETSRLLLAAQTGKQEAWHRLHERYRALMSFVAQAGMPDHLRGRFDPEDVVQSAFLSAFEALPRYVYRGEPAFRAWLKGITRNELMSRIRAHGASKRAAERELPGKDHDGMIDHSDEGDSPSQVVMRRQSRGLVLQAMQCLTDEQQEILWMRDFERRTWDFMGEVLDTSVSTARRRHHQALQSLLRQLR